MTGVTTEGTTIRVLLVESDEADYAATCGLLAGIEGIAFHLTWARSCREGLRLLAAGGYEVVLLAYGLGELTGLDFLARIPAGEASPPVIVLTGKGPAGTDLAAMRAGAADYVDKRGLTAPLLERSIRYAVERHGAQLARNEAEQRFHMLVESVGAIVWKGDPDTFRFTYVSREAEHLLGYPVEQWTAEPAFWVEHVHPDDRGWAVDLCRDATRTGSPHAFEYRMRAADGRVVWLRDVVRVVEIGGRRELAGVMVDVTEAKQAEAERARARRELEASHRLLEAIVDGTPDTVFAKDLEGRYLLINRAGAELLGRTPEDVVGRTDAELVSPAEAGKFREWDLRVQSSGEASIGESCAEMPAGRRYYHALKAPIRDPDGRVTGVVGISRDMTERKAMEDALRESNERFDLVQRATHDVTWDWNVAAGEVRWNDEIQRVFGYPAGVAHKDTEWWAERIHPDDVERVRASWDAALREADAWSAEYRYRRADGTYAVVFDRGHIQRDASGSVIRMIGSMQDVTEHRRLVAALEQSEAHYRRLVANAPQTIYALDAEGGFTELNPAGERLLGSAADAVMGVHFAQVLAPEDAGLGQDLFRRLRVEGEPRVETDLRIRRPSGELRWIHLDAAAIRDAGGFGGVHGIARDVTDERAREAQMRLFAAALENLAESVNVLDETGRIAYANAAHARMLGHDPAAPPAEGILAFAPDEDARRELAATLAQVRAEGVWRGRLALRRTDGQILPVEWHMERVEQEGQSLVFTIARDVAAELEQEHRLRRAERLASIGTLVGGVAHELNNPLAAIVGFTQLLLMDERTAAEREDLETIRREADRMAEIVSNLRLLSRDTQRDAGLAERVDLNDVVRHVLRTRAYSLRTHNVEVREDLDPDLPGVHGDGGQLEQVVLNLVVNAEQAMAGAAGSGVLIVRTRRTRSGVSLHVVDSGPGISAEHLERIFDPFFTTKGPGEGTGLGLSLAHSIIAEHGGEIRVDSRVGAGAAFRIDLPLAPQGEGDPRPAAAAPAEPAKPAVRPLRVLLVDDEEPVRRVISRFLLRRGHRVDEADEGRAALALLDEARDSGGYDVILSDLRMPGLGGGQLLARLRESGDGMERHLAFLTGDTASEEGSRILSETDVPVLTKPVALESLAVVLEKLAR